MTVPNPLRALLCEQVDLKATLFKAEEDAKRAKATGSAVPKSKVRKMTACGVGRGRARDSTTSRG